MRFSGIPKRSQKRGIRLSKREKAQLMIFALVVVIVVLVAMALGVKTRQG